MPESARQYLAVEVVDGVAVVSPLDAEIIHDEQIEAIRDALLSVVEDGGFRKILLNLHRVEFAKSYALMAFRTLHERLSGGRGELRVCGVDHQSVAHLMRISGYDKLLRIFGDEASALASF